MTSLSASVDGLTELVRTTGDASERLADLDDVNADNADLVVAAVEAPRLTGTLASTVTAVLEPTGFAVTAGGERAPYAAIVHARNPFLTRALNERESDLIEAYERHVTDTLDTIQGA